VYDLRHAQVLVLDEADRMFDLGFIADIRYILRRLPHPERRQSMLFSATLSHRVLELAYEHLNNPELVRIEPDKMTVDEVRQLMYYPSMEEKVPLLIGLLHQSEAVRTLVFVNTKRTAERLESTLKANGFNAQALSGDVPQNKRLRFLRDFHDGKLAVLIATDVASRGLHIPDVSHVFNFDLPQDEVEHVADVRDVQAARGHIGGDQDCEFSVVEVAQEAQALVLRHVPGERLGTEPVGLERALEPLGHALGVHEHHGAHRLALVQQPDEQRHLLLHGGVVHELAHLINGHLVRLDAHCFRVVHVLVGELEHAVRERGREQHGLAPLGMGQAPQDVADVGDEAQIEHAIGLIEHQHLGVPQVVHVLLEVIDQPPRRADQHLAPLAEFQALLLVVDATEHHQVPEPGVGAEGERI